MNFEKPKTQHPMSYGSKTSLASRNVHTAGYSASKSLAHRTSCAGKVAQPLHNSNFMQAQITSQGRTASAFYRSYNISNHMQISRPQAPNFHP